MKHLVAARLYCPTDSFAPGQTNLAPGTPREGLTAPPASVFAGFAAAAECLGEKVTWTVPLDAATAAGPPLSRAALDRALAALTAGLSSDPVDGVLLDLHGATAAGDEPDVAGRALETVRQAVGAQVPVVATLDLTANVTPRMLQAADVLVGAHTLPVTDQVRTGQRAAQALTDLLKVGARPEVQALKLPLIARLEDRRPPAGLLAHLWEHLPTAETLPGMLSVGLFMASPDLDAPQLGWVFYQACFCDLPALDERAVRQACWGTRQIGAEDLRARAGEYHLVSRPLYPLDDLEEMPLAAWAGDMINPCHCAASQTHEADEAGCGGCGKCCGRSQE